jgi:gluconate 5-dehydrogenase
VTAPAHRVDPFRLDGHRALITGSSGGIGFALARGQAGTNVVLNGRDVAKLQAAQQQL